MRGAKAKYVVMGRVPQVGKKTKYDIKNEEGWRVGTIESRNGTEDDRPVSFDIKTEEGWRVGRIEQRRPADFSVLFFLAGIAAIVLAFLIWQIGLGFAVAQLTSWSGSPFSAAAAFVGMAVGCVIGLRRAIKLCKANGPHNTSMVADAMTCAQLAAIGGFAGSLGLAVLASIHVRIAMLISNPGMFVISLLVMAVFCGLLCLLPAAVCGIVGAFAVLAYNKKITAREKRVLKAKENAPRAFLGNTAANMLAGAYVAQNPMPNADSPVTPGAPDRQNVSAQGRWKYYISGLGTKRDLFRTDLASAGSAPVRIAEDVWGYAVAGDWIYLRREMRAANGDKAFWICRMKPDGGAVEPVAECGPKGGVLAATQTHLFFSQGECPCCVPLGAANPPVTEFINVGRFPRWLTAEGDRIYYVKGSQILTRSAAEPQNDAVVFDLKEIGKGEYDAVDSVNVYRSRLFFSMKGLWALALDTGEVRRINQSKAEHINVIDDEWVYYVENKTLHRVRREGTGWEALGKVKY